METPVGTKLFLKQDFTPKLHPEVEPFTVKKGAEGVVLDDAAAGKVKVSFNGYNWHWTFAVGDVTDLFTALWIPEPLDPVEPDSPAALGGP